MSPEEILRTLRDAEPSLRSRGVARAALFGSLARGDHHPESDIDILVEIVPDSSMDLFRYIAIVQYIETLFLGSVDVANRESLKPYLRSSVEKDARYAF